MSARRHGLAAVLAVLGLVLLAPLSFVTAASADPGDESTQTTSPTDTGTPTDTPSDTTSAPSETVTVTASPTSSPTSSPTDEPEGTFTVDDAQLRWAINDETNNNAFAPGTINFVSAGKVPDPGEGGARISDKNVWSSTGARAWRATSGNVRVEKQQPGGSYATATFAGLYTTVAGTRMSGTNGPFSGHQVVLDGGTGTVDADAGTATISWKGSFSVVYYSGMTFFTATDPVLTVKPSGATLTATLGGYKTSMDDSTVWTEVPDRKGVVLADLPAIDLGADLGFTATPRYLGVRYAAPATGTQQVTSDPTTFGAFPRSYLAFMSTVGSGSYWYSSGGSADAHKIPAPITVSYAAGAPVVPPTDDGDGETDDPDPTDGTTTQPTTPVNPTPPPVTQPPAPSLPAQPFPTSAPSAAPTADPVLTAPDAAPVAEAGVVPALPGQAPTIYALASADSATVADPGNGSGHLWQWWTGSALLLAAAAITLLATRMNHPTKGRS